MSWETLDRGETPVVVFWMSLTRRGDLVAEGREHVGCILGGIPYRGSQLAAVPRRTTFSECLQACAVAIDSKLTYQHLKHVLKARSESSTAHWEVQFVQARYLAGICATSRSTGTTPRQRHHMCDPIPMSVDLDVGTREFAARVPQILVPEQRLSSRLSTGVNEHLGLVDGEELLGRIPYTPEFHLECQERNAVNREWDTSVGRLPDDKALLLALESLSGEGLAADRGHRLHGGSQVVRELLSLCTQVRLSTSRRRHRVGVRPSR